MTVHIEEILVLPVKKRLEWIEEIWDSIAAEPDAIPLTAAQRRELDRRKGEHLKDRLEDSSGRSRRPHLKPPCVRRP